MTNTSIKHGQLDAQPVSLEMFELLKDVQVPLSAELDRSTVSVQELMRWKVGTVVTLNRSTGENVDLFAGDVLLGNAEILVLDGKLAVRMADLKDKPAAVQVPHNDQ